MEYRMLGDTGLKVSRIAFGAGPIPAVMTGGDESLQREVVRRALDLGVNWFDTAAGYGNGQSEASLGRSLRALGAVESAQVATKVRLLPDDLSDLEAAIRRSLSASLRRLGVSQVALLQLHNAITRQRDEEPSSVSVEDVLGRGGVADVFQRLRDEGLARAVGLTGTGQADALRETLAAGRFQTVQTPYNLLNPSAGRAMRDRAAGGVAAGDTSVPDEFRETDYGNLFEECQRQRMGVFAIRVYAGGALAGQPPGPHTLQTRYFPLDLYLRDQRRAAEWSERLRDRGISVKEAAVRFSLSHPAVTAAIVGFSTPEQVEEAVRYAGRGHWSVPLA